MMAILIAFWILAIAAIAGMLKWKKPILLAAPFAAMGLYVAVQIILVPLPLWETIQMIMGMR
ncbi:hypothetical protein [Salibacterium halotolerans]|uniref:Uncharacterized protein n=1 Tax=Salibacterium halotolerans TaxID=1884432 RepID=A0A1I5X6M4_9BACI|nr:hypothetical protein [Salibacterium halotolerans]SFQ27476.1 hypothetical protein SAMN05518683_12523 [Salibacterium halotolerans]